MSAANLRMNNKRNQYHLICRVISICLCALFCLSFGCTSKKEERLQEIDFTVVDDDEIPEELKTIIDQKKTGEFKLTYADQDELYIVVGYGKQLTGGYSIQFPDDKREYCCNKCIAWSGRRRTCEYQLSIRGH